MRWQAIDDGKPAQNLPADSGCLVRLQSRHRVAPRGQNGHIYCACSSQGQKVKELATDLAMGRHGLGARFGWGGWGYLCVCAVIHFRGFWWGSEPQILLVQEPERLSDGSQKTAGSGRADSEMRDKSNLERLQCMLQRSTARWERCILNAEL